MKEYKVMASIYEGKVKCAASEEECEKCEARNLFDCQPATVIIKEEE